jgi:hypothetical protein
MKYDGYLQFLSKTFLNRLNDIYGVYGFEYGTEFEIAICEILREFLPEKYGICRGFVVSENGEKAGDDIIIYDQERFPTLRLRNSASYARKELIPIEAVYAYIEAKHTIDWDEKSRQSIFKAVEQTIAVKKLCSTRPKVAIGQVDPQLPPLFDIKTIDDMPSFRNPVYTCVIARNVKINGKIEPAGNEINNYITQNPSTRKSFIDKNDFNPEIIVLGKDNFMSTGYYYNGASEKDGIETLFKHESKECFYGIHHAESLSFGLFLAYLFASIDFIRLGRMPWVSMINEVIIPQK